eukprot:COSAG01_NODE_913_length_12779_cov_9.134385_6_plen_570_part_00
MADADGCAGSADGPGLRPSVAVSLPSRSPTTRGDQTIPLDQATAEEPPPASANPLETAALPSPRNIAAAEDADADKGSSKSLSPLPWTGTKQSTPGTKRIHVGASLKSAEVQHLPWTFACILTPQPVDMIPEYHDECNAAGIKSREMDFVGFVRHTAKKIQQSGLQVSLVHRSETTQDKVILLIRCPTEKFESEFRELSVRRWKDSGTRVPLAHHTRGDEGCHSMLPSPYFALTPHSVLTIHARARLASRQRLTEESLTCMTFVCAGAGLTFLREGGQLQEVLNPTEADRIYNTAMILCRSKERGGPELGGPKGNLDHMEEDPKRDPRIEAVFPMHNQEWRRRITRDWCKQIPIYSALQRRQRRRKHPEDEGSSSSEEEEDEPDEDYVPSVIENAIHVRKIGLDATGHHIRDADLCHLFSQYGQVLTATVRSRSEDGKTVRSRSEDTYGNISEDVTVNTSWALVVFKDAAAVEKVLAADKVEAGKAELEVNRYDVSQAQTSMGQMRVVHYRTAKKLKAINSMRKETFAECFTKLVRNALMRDGIGGSFLSAQDDSPEEKWLNELKDQCE